MPFSFTPIVDAGYAANAPTAIYTAPVGSFVRVDAFSVNNVDTVVRTIDIYLVLAAGSPSASNQIVTGQAILPGETWQCAEIIGQVLAAGSMIQVTASAATALVVSAAGMIQT